MVSPQLAALMHRGCHADRTLIGAGSERSPHVVAPLVWPNDAPHDKAARLPRRSVVFDISVYLHYTLHALSQNKVICFGSSAWMELQRQAETVGSGQMRMRSGLFNDNSILDYENGPHRIALRWPHHLYCRAVARGISMNQRWPPIPDH